MEEEFLLIGIITYHSAYNFGSVFQAYATQVAVKRIAGEATIINYRMVEQQHFYYPLYRTHYGVKTWAKDRMQLFAHKKRCLRRERFEKFIAEYFTLTQQVREPEEVFELWQNFHIMISGSDQIWNKHSCELEHNEWRYMDPYLLKGFQGRRISYASSVGNMTDMELQSILPELQQFDVLAFRESTSAKKMTTLLDRPVETVLDPTFLLTKDDWIAYLQLQRACKERYILAYFLCGPKKLAQLLPTLLRFAKKRECKVKLLTPFSYIPYPDKRVEYHPEYGPIEFMNALYNAEAVVTDSYHGTILSVNFGKDFYSNCKSGGSEFRKTDILGRLGLQDRIIHDVAIIPKLDMPSIDYTDVYAKLDALRQHSLNYLKTILKG